jgi:5-methylcytosine-specific restriction endonuclease McrA
MPKRTSDPQYLAARKALLKDSPLCHWCQRAQATEADHLVEHDRGGDNSLDNLVPACKPCNSARGQLYKARRDAQRQANRTVATGPLAAPFFSAEALPPTPKPQNPSLWFV